MAIAQLQHTESTHWRAQETTIINGTPVRFCDVCVYNITVGDVEDPDMVFFHLLNQWQCSEPGIWATENAVTKLYWIQSVDTEQYRIRYKIVARLSEQNHTFWQLKWQ